MIRQRSVDPVSYVGQKQFRHFEDFPAGIGTVIARGVPIIGVDKVDLIDLTVSISTAVTGGGTVAFDVYKMGMNRSITTTGFGTLVKNGPSGLGAALNNTIFDLRGNTIDPRGLNASFPNDFILAVRITPTGTVTTVTLGFALRYRPYNTVKDV